MAPMPIEQPEVVEHVLSESKRINIALSDKAYSELQMAAKASRRSMTEIVRLSLGLIKIIMEAEDNGQRMYVTTADGHAVKEIILPR
jgi:hypothetical protein